MAVTSFPGSSLLENIGSNSYDEAYQDAQAIKSWDSVIIFQMLSLLGPDDTQHIDIQYNDTQLDDNKTSP